MQQSKPSSVPTIERSFIAPSDIAGFLEKKNLRVILDTNILIQGCKEAHGPQRDSIVRFCTKNKVHITETIHYEFLRNLNIGSFREKYRALWKIVGGSALSENDATVKKWFHILSFVYFDIAKKTPKNIFFDYQENDRWIAACALGYGIDYILTTDHGGNGFRKEVFDDEIFDLSTKKHKLRILLKKVNPDNITHFWNGIQEKGGVHLSFQA